MATLRRRGRGVPADPCRRRVRNAGEAATVGARRRAHPVRGRTANMMKALAGVSVLDFTTTIAGPHCTRLLADLGADVIKIEAPEGDVMRTRPPLRDGVSSYFGQLNAGKRSVVLDLKDGRAVAVARRLAEQADILVENYRPGVMLRLGLDFAELEQSNPRLIYC